MLQDGIYLALSGRVIRGPFNQWGNWGKNLAYAKGYVDGMKIADPHRYDCLELVEILNGEWRVMRQLASGERTEKQKT